MTKRKKLASHHLKRNLKMRRVKRKEQVQRKRSRERKRRPLPSPRTHHTDPTLPQQYLRQKRREGYPPYNRLCRLSEGHRPRRPSQHLILNNLNSKPQRTHLRLLREGHRAWPCAPPLRQGHWPQYLPLHQPLLKQQCTRNQGRPINAQCRL